MTDLSQLHRFIDSAPDHATITRFIPHIRLDAFKAFLTNQITLMSPETRRTVMFSTISINQLLPMDTMQHILSFTDSTPFIKDNTDHGQLVCRSWKRLVTITESRFLTPVYDALNQLYRLFGENQEVTWIWDRTRRKLHKAEIRAGIKGILNHTEDLEQCQDGDSVLVRSNLTLRSTMRYPKLRFIGDEWNKTNKMPTISFTNNPSRIRNSMQFINCRIDCHNARCLIGSRGPSECSVTVQKCIIHLCRDAGFQVLPYHSLRIKQCDFHSSNQYVSVYPYTLLRLRVVKLAVSISPRAKQVSVTDSIFTNYKTPIVVQHEDWGYLSSPPTSYNRVMKTVELEVTNNEFQDLRGNAITYRRYANQPDDLEKAVWGSNRCSHTANRHQNAAQTRQATDQDSCDCQPNTLIIETRVWE